MAISINEGDFQYICFMANRGKVIITDKAHPKLQLGLEEMGYEVDNRPKLTLAELHQIIGDYQGVIINSKMIADQSLLDKATQLQFIGRLGSGLEIVDVDYATFKGIKVVSTPEGNCNAVAEHAMGMLLMLQNKLHQANTQVKEFIWRREANRGIELSGKTLGIIGFGHTGSALARKLAGWNVNILAYDKYKKNYTAGYDNVSESTPEGIQSQADIISFHLPLTSETIGLVNIDYLRACQRGVIIINTSRGQVITLKDLLAQLHVKHVGGACLDVLENENMDQLSAAEREVLTALFQLDHVVLSPHVAGWTQESLIMIADTLLQKIKNELDQII